MNTYKKENPLVSVVVLCYNQAKWVEDTLDSIKNQTYINLEVIIMDDASTDNSVDVIRSWIKSNKVDYKFIANKENQGICKALNKAIEICNGKYFEAVASDDIYLPTKTEKLVTYLEKNKNYYAVYSDALLINDDGSCRYGLFIQQFRNFINLPDKYIFNDLLLGNFIPAMGTLIKTSAIREINGWDEDLLYEDYDFWLRFSKKFEFGSYNTPLVKYRIHESNMHKSISFNKENIKILIKHIDNDLAKKKYQDCFFKLYKTNDITKQMRRTYYKIFSNSKSSLLIKFGLNYKLYSIFFKISNWAFKCLILNKSNVNK